MCYILNENSQDIYVGLWFALLLLVFVLPLVDASDQLLLSHPLAPVTTVAISLAAIIYYPGSDRWTPARYITCCSVRSFSVYLYSLATCAIVIV